MIDIDITPNQRIDVLFETEEPCRRVWVTILDASDDENAATTTAAYAAGEFDLDDLLSTLARNATITVEENDHIEHYTGATFNDGGVLADLDGVEPAQVSFCDYTPPPSVPRRHL